MEFFEQLGKQITVTGQKISLKTKNMVDISHLNKLISEKERQIDKLFLLLGRTYYENHKNDICAEEKDIVAQINTLHNEVLSFREKLDESRGVIKCANCGKQIYADSIFCNSCGIKIEKVECSEQDKCACPRCGKTVLDDNIFCNYCGTKIK